MKNKKIIKNVKAVIRKHSERLNNIDRLEVCYISKQKPKKILSLLKKGTVDNIIMFDPSKEETIDIFLIQNKALTIFQSDVEVTPQGITARYVCMDTESFEKEIV